MPRARCASAGESLKFISKAASGGNAVRNSCPVCGSLVFGGEVGEDTSFTIYAGALDDPSLFHPAIAIYTSGRPDWAVIPPGLKLFERGPQE
ncbi:MAG: GFA family protein [Xanthobacteraceae bacterium]